MFFFEGTTSLHSGTEHVPYQNHLRGISKKHGLPQKVFPAHSIPIWAILKPKPPICRVALGLKRSIQGPQCTSLPCESPLLGKSVIVTQIWSFGPQRTEVWPFSVHIWSCRSSNVPITFRLDQNQTIIGLLWGSLTTLSGQTFGKALL